MVDVSSNWVTSWHLVHYRANTLGKVTTQATGLISRPLAWTIRIKTILNKALPLHTQYLSIKEALQTLGRRQQAFCVTEKLIMNGIRGGAGLDQCAAHINEEFARVFLKDLVGRSIKILNLYMASPPMCLVSSSLMERK